MGSLLAALVGVILARGGDGVTLRGGEPAPSGEVREVSIEGVTVGSAVTAPVIIGWDRVREVTGAHADEARAFADISDMAWRARSRLERGDIPGAEPLFERLFVTYQHRQGPTAAAVCDGLLRCRLRRNAHTLAVGAWLAWLHAGGIGDGPQWYQRRTPAFEGGGAFPVDEATGLIPDLPPIWLDLPAVEAFGRTPLDEAGRGARESYLAALYRHAARLAGGLAEPMPRISSGDAGVQLVWDIVAAQGALETERASGRRGINARLRANPAGWEDAWLRTALGRSLLMEADLEERRRGVIELLRVRVVHERDCPYLAGLSLAEAAVALLDLGEVSGAGLLRRELLDRFPGHPAASWQRIMAWPDEDDAGAPDRLGGGRRAAPEDNESRMANG